MTNSTSSTFTELSLLALPPKDALRDAFVGKSLKELRTPAIIVDRSIFKKNCARVTEQARKRGMRFRAHVKSTYSCNAAFTLRSNTCEGEEFDRRGAQDYERFSANELAHKTNEGTRLQAEADQGVRAFIASTMPEVWQIVLSGLVQEGLIDDVRFDDLLFGFPKRILYSMPIAADRMEDLNDAQQKCGDKAVVRVMVDHPQQIQALSRFAERTGRRPWSCFVKVDGGGRRAGVPPQSDQMKQIIQAALATKHVEIYGFYSHFGQSYASKTLGKATEYFQGEVDCVNSAAQVARGLGAKGNWVLSVGATPTAHAATMDGVPDGEGLEGELELHAGCYCVNDLQQFATSLISHSDISLSVLSRVVSVYPHRSEAMCDAGALAVSKDTGPKPGYGHLVHPPHLAGWDLGRISQEHGTLIHRPGEESVGEIKIGDTIRIVPQHACLVCAGHPWFYVVEDGGDEVVDVWVPWKGW